jgi:hypothetical protein
MGFWGKLGAEPIAPEPIGATVTTSPPAAGAPAGAVELAVEKAAEQGDKALPDPSGKAGALKPCCSAWLFWSVSGSTLLG